MKLKSGQIYHRDLLAMKIVHQCPNLMNLSRGLNPPKTGFHFALKFEIENWIQFLVEPSLFERPVKFKPPLKFIKFGLQICEYIARVFYNVVFSTYLRSNAAEKRV